MPGRFRCEWSNDRQRSERTNTKEFIVKISVHGIGFRPRFNERMLAVAVLCVLITGTLRAADGDTPLSMLISESARESTEAGPTSIRSLTERVAANVSDEEGRGLAERGDSSFASSSPSGTVEVESYGEAPVDTTRQFLRQVTPLLARGQCQYDYGLVYSVNEFDFAALVAGPAATDINVRQRSFYTPLAVRYGLTDDTQLSLNLPIGWAHTEVSSSQGQQEDDMFGIGDLQLGITRLVCPACDGGPSIIGTLTVSAPTGDSIAPVSVGDAGLGLGAWTIGGSGLIVHSYDPVVVFYGAGYRYTFDTVFLGQDFRFGHQVNYNFGVGFSANERVTLSTIFLGSYATESEANGVSIPNSNVDAARMRFALTTVRCRKIIEPFVEIGVTDAAPSLTTGIVWTR